MMKRDMDLVRRLLLDLESAPGPLDGSHEVSGYDEDAVAYHLGLLIRSGFADGPEPQYTFENTSKAPDFVLALRLTPAGHDFVDTMRDETVWKKVKEKTAKAGSSVALDVIKAVGQMVVRQMLGLDAGS